MEKADVYKRQGIGGQAVMEGIMIRNGSEYSVAVRKENGEIEVKKETYKGVGSKCKLFRLPFIRGIFSFVDSLVPVSYTHLDVYKRQFRDSTMSLLPLRILHIAALDMRLIQSRICGLRQKIPFPKSMITPLRIFSRRSMIAIIRKHLRRLVLSISIH